MNGENRTDMLVQNMNNRLRPRLGRTPGLIRMNGSRLVVGGAHIGVYMPFAVLEPNEPSTKHTMLKLVKQLNRDDALLMCGFLNCVTSGSGPTEAFERQRSAYSSLYTPSYAAKIDAWIAEHQPTNRVALFFRGQLLELMRWVARHSRQEPGTGQSFELPEIRQIFLRAAFLAADLWSARTFADKLTGAATQPDALDRALGALRKGVEEAGEAMHIGVAMARGKFLFEDHVPARLPTFLEDFKVATGLTTEEYIMCAGMLMMKVFAKPIDGYFFRSTYANQTTFDAKFQRFLKISAQDAADLASGLWEDFDTIGFKAVRERPILLTSSGQCIVLDPTFFIDYFIVSPLFKILGRSCSANEVFGAFGRAFEDYAVSILQRVYPERPLLVKRLYTDVLHRKVNPAFQVDALVNDGDELVIMEMKASFIREDSLLSPDPELFLMELRKRYAVTGDPNDREVGVAQLVKCIHAIIIDRWDGADIDQSQVKLIFPVLVVHDERLGSPGVGVFFNRIFKDLLGEIGTRVQVAPLTVMTIHDLENIDSSETFHMRELLTAYVARSDGGMISLHNFMATDPDFKLKVRPSEALMRKSQEFLDQMQLALFPGTEEFGAPVNNSL
jgi:hypothetical protein